MKITIIKKNILSYKVGQTYDVTLSLGRHLIRRGLAEEVKPAVVIPEPIAQAPVIETPIEPLAPENKEQTPVLKKKATSKKKK